MPGDDQPVHEAASSGDVEKLKALLDENPQLVGAKGWFAYTPLHYAARAGSAECVRLLIERGADVNARDSLHSETPLFPAVEGMDGYGSSHAAALACTRLLLEHGADPNARDTHRGQTPVFGACSLEVLLLLEEYGADLNVVSDEDQHPCEYHAYAGREPAMLRFWLARGVDVNHSPGFGPPVLQAVVSHLGAKVRDEEKVAQVRLLLEYGADTEVADSLFGHTPLHTAAKNLRADLATLLLDAGANPNSRTHQGETPLHWAAGEGSAALVRLLLKHGADPDARDLYGSTPLDLAKKPAVRKVLEPVTSKQTPLPPTPEELIERLLKVPRLRGARLWPCSDREIAELEQKFGVRLPESYKKFLRLMGSGPRYFLECDHWEAFYPDLLEMGQSVAYEEDCPTLPENYFVFASRLGYHLFFVADGQDEDPPVYSFGDGHAGEYRKAFDSFWDFIREMVIYNEVYGQKEF